jgi:Ca-activated chloride channel family protein
VFGRYRGEGRGTVVIEGERNGRRERFTTDAVFSRVAAGNEFIPRLWASRRIGDLTRQVRLEGQSESLIREVRELGLRMESSDTRPTWCRSGRSRRTEPADDGRARLR